MVRKMEKTRLRIGGQCESGPVDINAHPSFGKNDTDKGKPVDKMYILSFLPHAVARNYNHMDFGNFGRTMYFDIVVEYG